MHPIRPRLAVLALAWMAAHLAAHGSHDLHDVRVWGMRDGLPQSSATAIAQTDDGYLWVGTFGGLARFNGHEFRHYAAVDTPGLDSDRVASLHVGTDGALWIGGEGLFSRLVDGRFEALRLPDGGVPATVWDFADAPDGAVWVATTEGLLLVRAAPDGEADVGRVLGGVWRSLVRDGDSVWVGGSQPRVVRLDADGVRREVPIAVPPASALGLDAAGRLWVGSIDRVEIVDPTSGRYLHTLPAAGLIYDFHLDMHGRMWVGGERLLVTSRATADAGRPALIDAELLEPLADAPDPGVRVVFGDRESNVWVGSDLGGLARLRSSPVVERIERRVGGLFLTGDGDIGLPLLDEPEGLYRYRGGRLEPLPDTVIARPVLRARNGDMHFGWRSRGDNIEMLRTRPNGAPPDRALLTPTELGQVLSLHEGDDGAIRVGCREGFLEVRDGEVDRVADAELDLGAVLAFAEHPDGGVWVGGERGLVRWVDGRVEAPFRDRPTVRAVRALHRDDDGVLWIGTYGFGLSRWDGSRLQTFTRNSGLADNFLSAILPGRDRMLWLNSNAGVFRIDRSDPSAGFRLIDSGEALGNFSPSSLAAPDGSLWFLTITGAVAIDPFATSCSDAPPRVVVEGVRVGDAPRDPGRPVRVEPEASRSVSIEYAGLSFREIGRTTFAYRLDGYDDDWIDAGTRRAAYYTGIPPGDYTFRVRATDAAGRSAETSSPLRIRIEPRWYEMLAVRIGGMLVGLSAVVLAFRGLVRRNRSLAREIAERRAAQRALEESETRLRVSERLKVVGQLAGGIAHDFNNLITVITGYCEILRQEVSDDAELAGYVDDMRAAAGRASDLTAQLLAFSRRQALHPIVLSTNVAVRRIHDLVERVLPENIATRLELDENVGNVRVDPAQLEQVLLNIVLNARDAMPEGGTLTLSTSRSGGNATIAIRDDGVGMSDEVRERVFDPFFSTKPAGKGTGLGLATAYGIVTQSGGTIDVVSAPGAGTTFRVVLPEVDAPAAPIEERDRPPDVVRRLGTVLLVEDDATVRSVLVKTLELAGYDVLAAERGDVALETFESRAESIDLVLSDVVMPGMSGIDLAREIRRRDPRRPVLLMSGYYPEQDRTGNEAGEFEVVRKPFQPGELIERVRAVLAAADGVPG